MSDAEWDDDDFDASKVGATIKKPFTDKWEGEDEDDDIKDEWDKESSEEEDSSKGSESSAKAHQVKKKKKIHEIIAEKEAAKIRDTEELEKAKAAEEAANTPEGRLAEKLRQQKIAELDSLNMAREMMGLNAGSIDSMDPSTVDEFDQLSKAIVNKVQSFNTSSHYNDFIEGLVKELSLDQPAPTLKKIKIHVETLHSTKLREEKASKTKKGGGGKARPSVKNDLQKDLFGGGGGGGFDDDLDDFM